MKIFFFFFLIFFPSKIFGLNEEWKGGDVKRFSGGGHKINILVRELKKYENDDKKILLFTDR